MMHNQPQESIWGSINTCVEIALNIYMIIAKDEHGGEHTGIMAHKDANLSSKAAEMAVKDGDWLCFDENTKDIPMYEVLQQRIALCKKIEEAAVKEMEEIKRVGHLNMAAYFGECPAPETSQNGEAKEPQKIRNGVFFIPTDEGQQLAVHESIAENYMTPLGISFGNQSGEYLYYSPQSSAVALNELKSVFNEVEGLIISPESLNATLHRNFPEYTQAFNGFVMEEEQIPETDAPVGLFLSMQLEAEKEKECEEIQEAEQDYGEQVDYGLEL